MAKRKTSVVLPGSLQSLVNQVQGGASVAARESEGREEVVAGVARETPGMGRDSIATYPTEGKSGGSSAADGGGLAGASSAGVGDEGWERFLASARRYRRSGGALSTIYIDGEMKQVLDRLKAGLREKVSTAALLSAIVDMFVEDHDREIRRTLFG